MPLEYHPLANLFPLIEGEEFDALVADIRANGIHDAIDLYQGKILDGRNRYRAAEAAGFDLEKRHFRHFMPELYGDPLAYVISRNLNRRHLDESQRAMVAARLATMRQGERTDLAVAEPSANLPKVDQPTAAKALSISERALRYARRVQDHGVPELVRVVDRGRLAVSAAEQASRLPVEMQRKIAEEAEAGHANVVRKVIKQEQRSAREAELASKIIAAPEGKFGVIVEDYEWDHETWSEAGKDRHAGNHYPVSRDAHSAEEIVARTVDRFACAADDCVFYMWTTIPHLAIAIDVMRQRGFTYKSHHVWVKDSIITGYWSRGQHEVLLIGTKGDVVAPAMGTQESSVIRGPSGEHSEKPECVMAMIERLWPNTPKLELNSRRSRAGWTVWGLDAKAEIPNHTTAGFIEDSEGTAPETQQSAPSDFDFTTTLYGGLPAAPEPVSESDVAQAPDAGSPIIENETTPPPETVASSEPAPEDAPSPAGAGSSFNDEHLEIPPFLKRQAEVAA